MTTVGDDTVMGNDNDNDRRRYEVTYYRATKFTETIEVDAKGRVTNGGTLLATFEGRHVDEVRLMLLSPTFRELPVEVEATDGGKEKA